VKIKVRIEESSANAKRKYTLADIELPAADPAIAFRREMEREFSARADEKRWPDAPKR